jgi:hypothetical protein
VSPKLLRLPRLSPLVKIRQQYGLLAFIVNTLLNNSLVSADCTTLAVTDKLGEEKNMTKLVISLLAPSLLLCKKRVPHSNKVLLQFLPW